MVYMDIPTYKAWSWYDGTTTCQHPTCPAKARMEVRRYDTPNDSDVTRLCHNHFPMHFIPAVHAKMTAMEDELIRIE